MHINQFFEMKTKVKFSQIDSKVKDFLYYNINFFLSKVIQTTLLFGRNNRNRLHEIFMHNL
jgi:hypothetical protein